MPIRITGLNSGLDTESIISALVSSYNYKTDKYKKAQTKLAWKQSAWKTLNTKIYSLYTNIGNNFKLSSSYNLKSTTVSDSTKATVTASNTAPTGTQKLNVIRVAQAGYLTGANLDAGTSGSTTLAELGYTGGDAKINLTKGDGTTSTISVSQGTTVSSFLASLKEADMTANFDEANKRIFVSSKKTGADNDFTLTGGNVDGVSALYSLGLNVGSAATDATYASYTKYYDANGVQLEQNVVDAIQAYQTAKTEYDTKSAQNGNLSAAYGYASAYSAMQTALEKSGLSAADQKKMQTLIGMSATERVNSVMDASGNVYAAKATDSNGNQIYSYKDASGNEQLIQRVLTYKGSDNNTYTRNADGTYTDGAGEVWTITNQTDADGNSYYSHTLPDGTEEKVTISEQVDYYDAASAEVGTGFYQYKDANGGTYTQNDTGSFLGSDGKNYRLDGADLIEIDTDGKDVAGGKKVAYTSSEEIKKTVYTQGSARSGIARSADVLENLKKDSAYALTEEEEQSLAGYAGTVRTYEEGKDTLDPTDPYSRKNVIATIQGAYASGGAAAVTQEVNTYAAIITQNKTDIAAAEAVMEEHSVLSNLAAIDTSTTEGQDKYDAALAAFIGQVKSAQEITTSSNTMHNADAKKIDGCDSKIKLNDIEYESSLNTYSINGLSINVMAETGDGDSNAITITTATDVQGMYDKIKDLFAQYNALINEMTSQYNADTAKGYEPLSSEEKSAMSDTEVELWEEKIKASLLRRDDSLESVMYAMTTSMSKGYEINGKKYYLSSFGIKTLGYLNAAENEQNAFHIDGDDDDAATKGNQDKLMAALTSDPDTVIEFMQKLTTDLYDEVGKRMKATTLSSTYTVYNDKEMASEYSDYTSTIKKWEEKLTAQEDYWYKKFAAMETALSKLNSQTSSLTSMLGG